MPELNVALIKLSQTSTDFRGIWEIFLGANFYFIVLSDFLVCAFVYNICFLNHFLQPMALNDTLSKKLNSVQEFVVVVDDDDEFFLRLVDKNKAFSLYPIRDHCQRSSP